MCVTCTCSPSAPGDHITSCDLTLHRVALNWAQWPLSLEQKKSLRVSLGCWKQKISIKRNKKPQWMREKENESLASHILVNEGTNPHITDQTTASNRFATKHCKNGKKLGNRVETKIWVNLKKFSDDVHFDTERHWGSNFENIETTMC